MSHELIAKLKSGMKACKNHPVIYYACDDLQCPYAHEGSSEHMECHHRLAADAWAYIRELERRRDP